MLLPPITRSFSFHSSFSYFRRLISSKCRNSQMGPENLSLIDKRHRASFRLCSVSGYKTDLLEIHAKDPKFHLLFIPGNPGVISFYVDFLESLYDLLGGAASVTAISHIGQTEKNWEHGRLFSLQEQTDHKLNFIEHELQDVEVPLVLVGHSIGSYISLDIFRRFQEKVTYCICLYPFLAVNTKSSTQAIIKKIAVSRTLCTGLSSLAAILALLPGWIFRFLVKQSVGKSWSPPAVEALRKHVLRVLNMSRIGGVGTLAQLVIDIPLQYVEYHTIQNILYMAMTEFEKLSEVPDWSFMREKKSQMAFLFGVDDHWGPLHIYEEISNKVPGAVLTVEEGGYTHAFSCTEAGSLWVAQHVSGLIKNYLSQ